MSVDIYNSGYSLTVTLSPFDGDRSITVQKSMDMVSFGAIRPATVNWGSIGPQSPAAARHYGDTIVAAANIAESLDRQLKTKGDLEMNWTITVDGTSVVVIKSSEAGNG